MPRTPELVTEKLRALSVSSLCGCKKLFPSTIRVTYHPYVSASLLISASMGIEHFFPLHFKEWALWVHPVNSKFPEEPLLLLFFFVNHITLPVSSLQFSVLCCCCRQHTIDKRISGRIAERALLLFDASDTCSYKNKNSFHKHIAGWCRRWMSFLN